MHISINVNYNNYNLSYGHIASGKRIRKAADDVSGMAINEKNTS